MSSSNFFSTYAAVRFAGGKKAKGVAGPLVKGTGYGLLAMMLAPVALIEWLVRSMGEAKRRAAQPVRVADRDIPRTASGYPRRDTDMQDLLDEMMEDQ